jgi:hypothetical protein
MAEPWLFRTHAERFDLKGPNGQQTENANDGGGSFSSIVDDGPDQVEKHHARNGGEESGARSGTPLSTSSFRPAG